MKESNHGKVAAAAASNKSATMKKDLLCKYCNKKFTSYQALGGHHNAHKAERAAEKQNKILSEASAYYRNSFVSGFVNSNHSYGFGGKTLGVSPLSMTPFKPHYSWSHMGVTHDYQHVAWPRRHILNPPQPIMHQFMAEGSGSHQHHKLYQPLISSAVRGGLTNSGSQPDSLHPSLCQEGNFGQASNSSIIVRPDENSCQENSSSSISMPVNGSVKKIDLTLKL